MPISGLSAPRGVAGQRKPAVPFVTKLKAKQEVPELKPCVPKAVMPPSPCVRPDDKSIANAKSQHVDPTMQTFTAIAQPGAGAETGQPTQLIPQEAESTQAETGQPTQVIPQEAESMQAETGQPTQVIPQEAESMQAETGQPTQVIPQEAESMQAETGLTPQKAQTVATPSKCHGPDQDEEMSATPAAVPTPKSTPIRSPALKKLKGLSATSKMLFIDDEASICRKP